MVLTIYNDIVSKEDAYNYLQLLFIVMSMKLTNIFTIQCYHSNSNIAYYIGHCRNMMQIFVKRH